MSRRKIEITPEILLTAYAQGYFPMPDPASGALLWFHPNPRAILPLHGFHVSKSLKRTLNKKDYSVTIDKSFSEVVSKCAEREETWINEEIKNLYQKTHFLGFAHSLEIWREEMLIGGVYGIALGSAFFAESMFHTRDNGSKIALYHLVKHLNALNFSLLEVQFLTPHLASLGAIEISRDDYLKKLHNAIRASDIIFKTQKTDN